MNMNSLLSVALQMTEGEFALFHMLSCLKMLTEDSSYELSHFKGGLP
ncbi:hypothetical protein [Piscirickettsia salmonis]|nr:hypothetical protein [Piscirickettsia salmonis]QGN77115.1 hypothetical protein Psal001_01320 [Piscirickettsia salmonis]QGN80704.1 hypothetical protein Psal002_01344 [Piscirickettsia salmonis]QGN85020.1 hypothetical protein Psal003_02084 [Piscirickettsia salmonis]QGN88529.1 hypothetical protein Psal004_02079 [Piscirickettsia salmonis]QGN91302.1 hypothetical protein Psal005_01330 [Piscirickettsia salmonis]